MSARNAFHNANQASEEHSAALLKAAQEARAAVEKLETLLKDSPPATPADEEKIKKEIERGKRAYKKAEQQLFLDKITPHLAQSRQWIGELSDPDCPDAGKEFLRLYDAAHFRIEVDPDLGCTAAYCSFSLAEDDPGFINRILFGGHAAEDPIDLFNADVHEALHGFQKKKCGALQASPFNELPFTITKTDADGVTYTEEISVVICPEDWLILQERCEQDAYAKQAWLNSLLAEKMPEALEANNGHALNSTTFNACRAQAGGNLQEALAAAAQKVLETRFFKNKKDGSPYTGPYHFAHNWQDIALRGYADAMDIRKKDGQKNFVFVRIQTEDVHDIGKSFGPNPFGDDHRDPALLKLTAPLTITENKPDFTLPTAEKLKDINDSLGITDKNDLPTLRDFLAAHDITMTQFMTQSMVKPAKPAVVTALSSGPKPLI